MLTTQDLNELRPHADNFDAASPALLRKLDAHIAGLNAEIEAEFATVLPPVPPVFAERNRKNAQKSTGPKTVAGKAAASQNRLAHGLCAKSLLIAGETESDFDQLRQSVVAAYQPVNAEESLLTDQVAQALWRFNRAQRVESTYLPYGQSESHRILASRGHDGTNFQDLTEEQGDGRLVGMFLRQSGAKEFERIQRYLTTAERSYHRAVKLLQHAQEKRRNLPRPAEPVVAEAIVEVAAKVTAEPLKVAAAGSATVFVHQSGFVSQNGFRPLRMTGPCRTRTAHLAENDGIL